MAPLRTLWYYRPSFWNARRFRRPLALLSLLACLLFVALFIWHSGVYYQPVRPLSLNLRVLSTETQFATSDDGIHLNTIFVPARSPPKITFSTERPVRPNHYYGGHHIGFGGFHLALLTKTRIDDDLIESPYATLVFPYWLLILVLGAAASRLAGLWPLLIPPRHWSRPSRILAAVILGAALFLNVIPWDANSSYYPSNFLDWLTLFTSPTHRHNGTHLTFGFPFTYHHLHYINSTLDASNPQWLTLKLMENLSMTFLTILFSTHLLEWSKIRQTRKLDRLVSLSPAGQTPPPTVAPISP